MFASEKKYELLTERQRSFIPSCESRMYRYLDLSAAQVRWLFDLAARFKAPDISETLNAVGASS